MSDRTYRFALPYTEVHGRRCPMVPVTFTYHRTTQPYFGLVDSGAQRTLCSVAIAEEAGIDLSRFPLRRIRGVGGPQSA
jgi:hypothetical protein